MCGLKTFQVLKVEGIICYVLSDDNSWEFSYRTDRICQYNCHGEPIPKVDIIDRHFYNNKMNIIFEILGASGIPQLAD
jgi:hypothetical protein